MATKSSSEEGPPPPTLRGWVTSSPFALSVGQGFGGEFASLGAVRGLVGAFGGIDAIFRAHLTAVSGASSGAKVAALLAQPSLSLEEASNKMLEVRASDVFFGDWAFRRGGVSGGEAIVKLMERCWGRGCQIEGLPLSFGTTAFDLTTYKSVALTSGDLARVCQASGSFPVVFAPSNVDGVDYWDFAYFTDPAGTEGLQKDVAFKGNDRLLQIVNADWNLTRWIVKKPSDLGCGQVLSLVLKNHTRVVPFWPPGFGSRARIAYDEAKAAVDANLDRPLTPLQEPGHYLCVIDPTTTAVEGSSSPKATEPSLTSNAAVATAVLGIVVLLLSGGGGV